MGLNNWSVASKVRKGITFSNVPVISEYVDVKFTGKEIMTGVLGVGIALWTFSFFPSDQILEAVIAVIATLIMTIYLLWRSSANPEKSNMDMMMAHLVGKPHRKFKKLTISDLKGNSDAISIRKH
ncbi:MAG: hypothetical protein LBT37_05995 [Lactobacillaceae bacterium]|jgi:hypothetical protein|nr:hypothetical protein [Lactobacillaceae bacterium]